MGKRVLVVDDDPDLLATTAGLLRDEGYTVDTARNGQEALNQVPSFKPDVILLDLMMPVMDGWQFVDELRKGPDAQVPIIVLSASYGIEQKAKQLGAASHLGKPFDLSDLLKAVGKVTPP